MTSSDDYGSPRRLARIQAEVTMREVILAYARATGGQHLTGAHPLPCIAASRLLENIAARFTHDYVRLARRDGASWDEIGLVLGFKADEDTGRTVAEQGFEESAAHTGYSRQSFVYTCGSCGEHVTDGGPYNAHPLDNESGHAGDCARIAAAVAAYQAERARDDAEFEAGQ